MVRILLNEPRDAAIEEVENETCQLYGQNELSFISFPRFDEYLGVQVTQPVLEAIGANPDAQFNELETIKSAIKNKNTNAVKWAAAKSWGDKATKPNEDVEQISTLSEETRRLESSIVSDVDLPRFDQEPENSTDFAVVAGISKYQLPLPEAKFAERDALTVAKYLQQMGIAPSRTKILIGNKATAGALKRALNHWLPENVKPGSNVYFYFSGHGSPNTGDKSAYLVPWDGDPSDLGDTALPLADVYKRLGSLGAKHVLVALDSCFSGVGGRSVVMSGARPLVTKLSTAQVPPEVTVMTAASEDEITQADDSAGHGLFTYYLLSGLNAGISKANQLCSYLKPKVADKAALAGGSQNPVCFGPDFGFRP